MMLTMKKSFQYSMLGTFSLAAFMSAVPAQAEADKTVYEWVCKTRSGEIVLDGTHSVPLRVGQVIGALLSALPGKGIGVRDAGPCSRIRYDLDGGKVAYCEPTRIPAGHAFYGGWTYRAIDKSQCNA